MPQADSATGSKTAILDVGCGIRKYPGSIGIDINRSTAADVIATWIVSPTLFADRSFDRLRVIHVIEHLTDVIGAMEEFHRLLRPGGRVRIETPHYTDFSSFCDPTHKQHLNSFSFRYFGADDAGSVITPAAKFHEIFYPHPATILLEMSGFEFLVNTFPRFRRFWEHYLCYVVRGKSMEFEFEPAGAALSPGRPAALPPAQVTRASAEKI